MPIYQQLLQAFRDGDFAAADALQARSVLLVQTLAGRGYGPSSKLVMKLLGVDCGPARLPLRRLEPNAEAELRGDLERIGFFDWIDQ